jgi:DNA primase
VKKSSSGNLIDRFRNRLMFPILDEHSRVIAFGGRTMAEDDKGPKYLNSPETPVYAKGRVLYGLNWAASRIRSQNSVMIVEGYMDLIALHQAGLENAVASSGTAFTESQCRTLKRYSSNLVMIFDGDDAGRKAAARATEIAASQHIRPSVAMLPPGVDPDELVKTGGATAFMEIVKEARPYLSYLIEQACRKHDMATAEGRADAARSLLPELANVADPIERSSYVEALAQRTQIPAEKIEARLRSTSPRYAADAGQKPPPSAKLTQRPKKLKPASPFEKCIMRIILDHPEILGQKLSALLPGDFQTQAYGRMLEHIQKKLAEGSATTGELIESLEDIELQGAMRSLVMESGVYEEEGREKLIDDFLTSLRARGRPATLEMAKTAAENGKRDEYLRQQENLRKL